MKWIKASERTPDHYRLVHLQYNNADKIFSKATARYNPSMGHWIALSGFELKGCTDLEWLDESLPAPDLPENSLTAFQNEPVSFLLLNALRHLTQDQQMQLCNALRERLPPPASAEDEAARMYPPSLFPVTHGLLQEGYINAANRYTGEIERLKNDLAKLEAENKALIEEIQNWKDELKDQAREHRNNR